MKPIPTEWRKQILDDCDHGMSEHKAAEKWKVGRSTIAKIKKQRRETGSIEPKIPQTGPKPKLKEHRERLKQIVTETPDATLEEIRDRLPVHVSIPTVFNELRKLKLVYKKTTPRFRARTS
jgi:Transposase and inactivated derivatives